MNTRRILVMMLCLFWSMSIITVSSAEETVIEFTEEEKAFIEEHPTISLGIDPSFVPFEFLDIDGHYKGIARDYINLLSERIGINMVIAKDLTWSETYELAVEKEIDVLPCVSQTKERQRYFNFSEPYYYFQRVIVVKDSNKSIESYEDLKGLDVAVQKNSSHHSFLIDYPEINLKLYNTVEEALGAVAFGSETAFVGNLATSSYLIKSIGLTDFKYVPFVEGEQKSLHFAVRDDWPELVGIINKGLASITSEEKIEINNRWIGIENKIDYGAIIRIASLIGIIILLIILVSVYWITRLKKEVAKRILIEKDLLIAKNEAESANYIKSSFLARMSHEIRTPLNAITGMAYILKKTDISITQKMHLERITQASSNMLSIINDILDFSKIEAGKIEIENISFDLDKIIQNVLNIVSFKIEEQGIGFSLIKEPKLPNNFYGDPKRIEQVLLNIINNAVKFTNEGEVSLGVRMIAHKGSSYHIEFSIKDTGIGMSEDHQKQLFEPFSQEDSSINRRFGGTGLGLSIVKSLVEMMDGKIEVYSTEGKGSTFVIKLVLEADVKKEKEKKEKAAAVYFQDIKTIILDKAGTKLNQIGSYVESFSMHAELSTSEVNVMEMLEANSEKYTKSYDLLILDYDTPEDDGFEFIKKIRMNDKITKKPKIIIMFPFMREDLFDFVDDSDIAISKPIIPSVLYNGILELFKSRALESKVMETDSKHKKVESLSKTYHALVVEDNKTNQFIAKSILEEVGFVVSLADNGEIGVNKFKENKEQIDIILMDLHMPVMNGYDATNLIREMDVDIPIVAMTADAITGVEEKCKEYGIDFYISKPFEPEAFIDKLIKIIEEKSMSEDYLDISEDNEMGSMLNKEEGMKHLANNPELYELVLAEYLKENRETAAELAKEIEEKDFSEAAKIVHKIKSSSASIGAKELYVVATDLQKSLESEDISEIENLHSEFDRMLIQLISELEKR